MGSVETEKMDVLNLALEDNKRRFQKRMRKLLEGRDPPPGFYYVNDWSPLDQGGLDALKRQLDEQPSIGLIVVDTLELIRPARRVRDGVYADDVRHFTRHEIRLTKMGGPEEHNLQATSLTSLRKQKGTRACEERGDGQKTCMVGLCKACAIRRNLHWLNLSFQR